LIISFKPTAVRLVERPDDDVLDRVFFALSDPSRRAILERLDTGPLLVSELAAPFKISLQPVSRRIQVLVYGLALVVREQQSVWHDPGRGFVRHIVSPPSGALSVEIIRCELAAHQSIFYERPPVTGQEHHLMMLSGALTVSVEDETYRLKEGDCLRYRLFGSSRFVTGRSAASYFLALS
jgi:DNA-binding transcriptional ArsR family regulator